MSEWLFSKVGTTTGVGTIRWKKYTIEQLIVAKLSTEQLNTHLKSESEGGKKKNGSGSTEDFPPFGRFLSELCGERGAGNPVSEKKQSGTGDGDGYCQNDIPY